MNICFQCGETLLEQPFPVLVIIYDKGKELSREYHLFCCKACGMRWAA